MPPKRLRIVGVSGAGKTRLAQQVAERTGLPRLELDAVFWAADWTLRDRDEARELVREFTRAHPEGWVIDGNWTSGLDGLLDPGAAGGPDVVVWLDHSRANVMRRVIARTVARGIRREELWHGNREDPRSWLKRNPEDNIMLWAWTRHAVVRERMLTRLDAGEPIVRLRGQTQVDAWLDGLSGGSETPRPSPGK